MSFMLTASYKFYIYLGQADDGYSARTLSINTNMNDGLTLKVNAINGIAFKVSGVKSKEKHFTRRFLPNKRYNINGGRGRA